MNDKNKKVTTLAGTLTGIVIGHWVGKLASIFYAKGLDALFETEKFSHKISDWFNPDYVGNYADYFQILAYQSPTIIAGGIAGYFISKKLVNRRSMQSSD